jgi:2-polyprenyl-6-methoxyphenol hydroxylase-like FAD-dependent oxidoreductase
MESGRNLKTACCVAGGGPAGVMLGFLLARAGINVVVLEKHADFFRDFRGDTIHPSTLNLMEELGLLDEFLQIPHSEMARLTGRIGDTTITIADFAHVAGRCKFIAFMPQWDFLKFLAARAQKYPAFHLEMEADATDLVRDGDRVVGVRAQTPAGPLTVSATLVVAADGRHSTLRERAGLEVIDVGAPIDVLWTRISKANPGERDQTLGNIVPGGILVAIDRRDYYQCAFVIRKGGFEAIKAGGIEKFRADIARIAPFLAGRVDDVRSWDDVKLLTVAVDRLRIWYSPGLLCIGDAAHAMSPVGGIGINLAIQDAVAAANLLFEPLRSGAVTPQQLAAFQRRRELPTRLTQALQVFIQNRILNRVLATTGTIDVPAFVRFLFSVPLVRWIPARLIGMGFRPEHVRTPAA